MKENSLIRENLMTREGYAPYCGEYQCVRNMPRTIWDPKKSQFTCSCGWVSEFAADFIKRYKERWNLPS